VTNTSVVPLNKFVTVNVPPELFLNRIMNEKEKALHTAIEIVKEYARGGTQQHSLASTLESLYEKLVELREKTRS
jgi:hypothetical protein